MDGMIPAGLGGMPGGPGAMMPDGPPDDGKMIDLSDQIEKSDCYARNQAPGFTMTNLFIGDSRLGCKSDADEQLILHISFKDFVRIKSIKFVAFNNGEDPECNPSTVKLYVNRNNLGFEDIDDVEPTQVLNLTSEDLRESSEPMMTKFVKFQRVKTLTIFVEDNNGGDVSALGSIKLLGRTVATMNMNEFKKNPNQT
jgi:PITH domain